MIVKIKCKGSSQAKLSDLIPIQGDLKNLSDENYQKLKKEIIELGFSAPFFCWTMTNGKERKNKNLLDGHQRHKTLTRMAEEGIALPELFPIVDVDAKNINEAKKKVLAISSNYGTMTKEGLTGFLDGIVMSIDEASESFTFDAINFDEMEPEVEKIDGQTDEDSVPELQPDPIAKRGDVWLLGNHRLMCGDSTMIDDVEKLMNGEKADMVFTDPPYGVNYSGGIQFTDNGVKKEQREKLANDHSEQIYTDSVPMMAMFSNGPIYTWYAASKETELLKTLFEYGDYHAQIIWVKDGGYSAMNATYKQKHEPCVFWKPKGKKLNYIGTTTETTIWDMKKDKVNKLHPTQKPVELAERAISNHNAPSVLDLFLGSGSTLIACEKTNRKCYGMELDEKYCDVIIKRWQEYTGKKATLEGTGETYDERKAEG